MPRRPSSHTSGRRSCIPRPWSPPCGAASPSASSTHERRTIPGPSGARSEEHTSELQSPCNLVCRLLLEKKKTHMPPLVRNLLHQIIKRSIRYARVTLHEELAS